MAHSKLIWYELISEDQPILSKDFKKYCDSINTKRGVALWKSRESNSFFLCVPNSLQIDAKFAFKNHGIHRLDESQYPGLKPGMSFLDGDKKALEL